MVGVVVGAIAVVVGAIAVVFVLVAVVIVECLDLALVLVRSNLSRNVIYATFLELFDFHELVTFLFSTSRCWLFEAAIHGHYHLIFRNPFQSCFLYL